MVRYLGRFECKRPIAPAHMTDKDKASNNKQSYNATTDKHTWPPCHIWGPYALKRSVNFVFLLLARQNKQASFALARASVNFVFLLLARQNKQVSFALARASVRRYHTTPHTPRWWFLRYRASNVQMSEWKFAYIHNEWSHYSPKAQTQVVGAPKKTRMPNLLGYHGDNLP